MSEYHKNKRRLKAAMRLYIKTDGSIILDHVQRLITKQLKIEQQLTNLD